MSQLKAFLKRVIDGDTLSIEDCKNIVTQLVENSQHVEPLQLAALLAVMHARGETADEITGFVRGMQDYMLPLSGLEHALDIVGSGGDGANTINISTAAAIVAGACGATVVKHGNRAVSSKCGSADVLSALGVNIEGSQEAVQHSVKTAGIAFCFAPNFHPAFAKIAPIRKALAVPTVFNFLGPLLNPAQNKTILLGCAKKSLLPTLADALIQLNFERAMVVYGQGLDELNLLGPADVIEINHGEKKTYQLDPHDYGFEYGSLSDIQGGDIETNVQALNCIFAGEPSSMADTVSLNAGAALYLSGQASDIAAGIRLAQQTLLSGNVAGYLNRWRACYA